MITLHQDTVGAFGGLVDLSPLAPFFTIAPRVLHIGTATIADWPTKTRAQMRADVEALVAFFGVTGGRLVVWEYEAAANNGIGIGTSGLWTIPIALDAQAACEEGYPDHLGVGGYRRSWSNLLITTAGPQPALTALQAENDNINALVTIVDNPDFYWLYPDATFVPVTIPLNLTEVARAVANSGGPRRIAPFVRTKRPDVPPIGWTVPVPLEGATFRAIIDQFEIGGITEFVLWEEIDSLADVEAFNAVIRDWANAMAGRGAGIFLPPPILRALPPARPVPMPVPVIPPTPAPDPAIARDTSLASFVSNHVAATAERVADAARKRTGLPFRVVREGKRAAVICQDPAGAVLEYGTNKVLPQPWVHDSIREGGG